LILGAINIFSGNYTFWYETSQIMRRQTDINNKKVENKRQELMEFIARFSANASNQNKLPVVRKPLKNSIWRK
jgi:ATPase subunit of ABC transporter with duplicated ATPase domains